METFDRKSGLPALEWSLFYSILAAWSTLALYSILVHRPGYLAYDEECQVAMIQWLRQGNDQVWRLGGSSIHHQILLFMTRLFGPNLSLLRISNLLAVTFEPVLVYLWLRPRLGARAALWAGLADLISSATFGRAVSMMAVAKVPCLFLLHAICLDRVLAKPWQAFLWALSLMIWCFDYEGWMGAVLVLGLWAIWSFRHQKSMLLTLAAGATLGALLIWLAQGGLQGYAQARAGLSLRHGAWWRHAWPNIRALLGQEDRMPLSAAPFHPYPAPWIWLPAILGIVSLKKDPRLILLLGIGLLPLFLFQTDAEPHRLILFHLGAAACAGYAISLIWGHRSGRILALGLLLLGLGQESFAWSNLSNERINRIYGRSHGLLKAAQWLKDHPTPGGWEVIHGLGPNGDLDFQFLLEAQGINGHGKTPVALLYWDYAPGFKALNGALVTFQAAEERDLILAFPDVSSAERLRKIQSELAEIHLWVRSLPVLQLRSRLAESLAHGRPKDPWARTVAWEAWMYTNTQLDEMDGDLFAQALTEPLVSGWFYDIAAQRASVRHPKFAAMLWKRSDALDPRRKAMNYRYWRD